LLHQIEEYRYNQDQKRQLIASKTEELKSFEQARSRWLGDVTERRVGAAERRQEVEYLSTQRESLEDHMKELDEVINERSEGANSYQVRIADLRETNASSEEKLEPLQAEVHKKHEDLEEVKKQREETSVDLEETTKLSSVKRDALDELRSVKGQLDIELAEKRMRHQNTIERVCSDYRISREQMLAEEEPEWDGGKTPDLESIETTVAEHRATLESIGPVNLVAIEEHDELQERYEFLTAQQEDLVKAKQQLMEMIRRINKTTTELFTDTFNKVNENFQVLFKKLFGGGSAKLVLVDEEDILESGIEIIARPPGKKLQTVSLLSGGERTMTAVALLFSLYQVKASPFCVLDELDAALDDANIGRFVEMLKGFLHGSQFIVITHNRQTIGASDILYGVTMEQQGVSKIVSVKFADHEKQKVAEASEAETSAPA